MPRQTYKISGFEGGLNTEANPRDLDDNQLTDVSGFDISRIGRIQTQLRFGTHSGDSLIVAGEAQYCPVWFTWNVDNKMVADDGSLTYLPSDTQQTQGSSGAFQQLLCGIGFYGLDVYPRTKTGTLWSGGVWLNPRWYFNTGQEDDSTSPGKTGWYIADGALRVSDSTNQEFGGEDFCDAFPAGVGARWIGPISGKRLGGEDGQIDYGGFHTKGYQSVNRASGYQELQETGNLSHTDYNYLIEPGMWWHTKAAIDGCFPTRALDDNNKLIKMCRNAAVVAQTPLPGKYGHNCNNGYAETSASPPQGYFSETTGRGVVMTGGMGLANEWTDIGEPGTSEPGRSGINWGCELAIASGEQGSGTWSPEANSSYKFYITTMYDDHKQESQPQLMGHYGGKLAGADGHDGGHTNRLVADATTFWAITGVGSIKITSGAGLDNWKTDHNFKVGQWVQLAGFPTASNNGFRKINSITTVTNTDDTLTFQNASFSVEVVNTSGDGWISPVNFGGKVWTDTFEFTNGQSTDDARGTLGTHGRNVRCWMRPVFKINGAEHGDYAHAQSSAYGPIDNEENYVYGYELDTFTRQIGEHSPTPRISGNRIYFASNEDGYSTLWLIFDCDFRKGVKTYGMDGGGGESGWTPWKTWSKHPNSGNVDYNNSSTDRRTTGHYLNPDFETSNRWLNPPRYLSFESINGYSHKEDIHIRSFRTAVVANRRVYVGNVTRTIDGQAERFSDRIYKSPPNKFDTFPESMYIDVSVNDGEEIIHLATFSDRLLEFKNNTLNIINISQDMEFLEKSFPHKGVSSFLSVCTTDLGVAWVNQYGAYFYDGQQVKNLLEKAGKRLIKESTWSGTMCPYPRIGYDPKRRQLWIANSNGWSNEGGNIPEDNDTPYEPKATVFDAGYNGAGGTDKGGGWLYDIATQSWSKLADYTFWQRFDVNPDTSDDDPDAGGDQFLVPNCTSFSLVSNFINDPTTGALVQMVSDNSDNDLTLDGSGRGHPQLQELKYDKVASPDKEGFVGFTTKDLDFGHPGVHKKVYKLKFFYKCTGVSNLYFNYAINGSGSFTGGVQINLTAAASGNHHEIEINENNIYSIRFKLQNDYHDINNTRFPKSIPGDFSIDDMTVIYRLKRAK